MKKNANANHQGVLQRQEAFRLRAFPARPLIRLERPLVRTRGMTLIELMTVLAVAVILITVAVPGVGEFIRNARMVTQTNEFVADLAYARSEAIKRAKEVIICKSTNPTDPSPSCNTNGDDWSSGWIIFVDNQPANNAFDAGEEVVRTHSALLGNNTLFAAAAVANQVTYMRNGLSTLTAVSGFALCDQRGTARGRFVALEVTGRATIGRNPDACNPA